MSSIQINSISDLLNNFIPKNVEEIEQQIIEDKINHPVTIGSMYESLTKDVIDASIFKNLDLHVVTNSHIVGSAKEFDVLLIEGAAKQVGSTDRYICTPEQVVAIIQVKKNLYASDLKDAYNNLKSIVDYYENQDLENYMVRMLRDAFRSICRKDILKADRLNYTSQEDAIYTSLSVDAQLPLRIVWGYHGFKSELNFREAFYNHIASNVSTDVENIIGYYGPHNFPNLIINGDFTMLKNNGMPFGTPLLDDNSWAFYNTTAENPIKYLLEILWTRLSYKYELDSDIFGEDLVVDQVNLFLDAKHGELEGHMGWHYNAFSPSEDFFKNKTVSIEWSPVELDAVQNVIITELCKVGFVNIDHDLTTYVTRDIYTSQHDFIDRLVSTGLVHISNNQLKLLTDQCQCIIHPNGKFYAADNKSNRLTNWLLKEMNSKNSK